MKHLFIRPESKLRGKIGRGKTVVLHETLEQAAIAILDSFVESHGYTGEEFKIILGEPNIIISTSNDRDYYRWLDILDLPVHMVTIEQDEVLIGNEVANNPGALRYNREEIEMLGFDEELVSLSKVLTIRILKDYDTAVIEDLSDTSLDDLDLDLLEDELRVPLTEIINFGDVYDLPVSGIKPGSLIGRFFNFLGSLVNKSEGGLIETRKPVTVFESYLGGHIAIYKSLTTDKEVDIALFNRYGNLVNVFSFQDGCPHQHGINGVTIEDLISISAWRIIHVNSFVAAPENVQAVTYLQEALDQLEHRTARRYRELAEREGS